MSNFFVQHSISLLVSSKSGHGSVFLDFTGDRVPYRFPRAPPRNFAGVETSPVPGLLELHLREEIAHFPAPSQSLHHRRCPSSSCVLKRRWEHTPPVGQTLTDSCKSRLSLKNGKVSIKIVISVSVIAFQISYSTFESLCKFY